MLFSLHVFLTFFSSSLTSLCLLLHGFTVRAGCAGCAHIRAVPRTVTKFKCYSANFF